MGTSKNVGLGKFEQDLEILKAFLVSLEVSGLFLLCSSAGNFLLWSLGLGFLTRYSGSSVSLGTPKFRYVDNLQRCLVTGGQSQTVEKHGGYTVR